MKSTIKAQKILTNAEVSILHKNPLRLLVSLSLAILEGGHDEGF